MVDTQVRPSDVTKFPIIDAMLNVPREDFVQPDSREIAYVEDQLPVAPGRTMLEPRTLAKVLDALAIELSDVALVVAPGLGYSAAIVSRMADVVIAVEEDETLAKEAEATLSEGGFDNAVVLSGPHAEGAAQHGPYDVILSEGGLATRPEALEAQLRDGGRIAAVFMSGALGVVRIGSKIDGQVVWRDAFNASAPLLAGFEVEQGFVF